MHAGKHDWDDPVSIQFSFLIWVIFQDEFIRLNKRIFFMKAKISSTQIVKPSIHTIEKSDPAWESIKAGLESIKRGKITEWKPRFSK